MKKILTLLFCSLLANLAFAGDYYYYMGKRIDLNQRDDKVIIVTNEYSPDKALIENQLKNILDAGDELRNPYSNTYQVVFKNGISETKVQNYLNRFRGKENLIKFVSPAYYTSDKKITIIAADEFIVKLKSEHDRNKLDILNIENGVQIIESIIGSRQFTLKTFNGNSKTSLDLSEVYLATGLFEYCEPNFIYPDGCLLHLTPNDPLYPSQWHLNNTGQTITANTSSNGIDPLTYNGLSGSDIDANLAWDHTTGSAAIEIGVVDTGIDSVHPDLQANLLAGYDAVYNVNSVPRDSQSHGTATGGLIGAIGNNSVGVTGIAYGCKIRSYRIFSPTGSATTAVINRAFQRAKINGAAIMSNSWGGGTPTASTTAAIDSCATYGNSGKGCVILFSSGNDGRNPPSYPSRLSSVICVGSSTAYDQKKAPGTGNQFWWGGNYGAGMVDGEYGDLDIVAPTITVTTDRQGTPGYSLTDYVTNFNGTSCSCPVAAGVAGLVYSVNPSQTAAQVKDALIRGCDKIDNIAYDSVKSYGQWNSYFGYGRINAYKSVRLAAGQDITPPSIIHDNVESHNSTYPTALTANIIDQNGTAIDTSVYKPKVIYRTNKNNAGWSAFDSSDFTSKTGNNFTFKIPGYGWETQVQYYLKAKDAQNNTALFPLHAPDTTNLCYYSIGNIQIVTQKITGPTTIPSVEGTSAFTSTTTFSSFKILKTKVRLYLREQALLFINFSLVSPISNPALNSKCLFSQNLPPFISTGITNATVVDSANQFWYYGAEPYTGGFFKPEYSFRGLNGLNASGNWRLLFWYQYDSQNGYLGTFDSCFISLYRTSGTLSPSAGVGNAASDSIAAFDGTNTDTVNFYLKNRGTAALTISGTVFNGTYASKFSLVSSPSSIAAGDSGLFQVRCDPLAPRPKGAGSVTDEFENATMDISTNDPSKPTVKVSLQTPEALPVELASFSAAVERNNVKLNWMTVFEINNSGFDIERKLLSESNWNKIGNVQGAGSINSPVNYSYSDNNVTTGKYNYRLKQIDFNGNYEYFALSNEVNVGVPAQFNLSQNYPNPFNPATRINYELPITNHVSLKIFDATGREIMQLVNEVQQAGYYTVQFNASNFASGIYFYSINAEGGSKSFVKTMKMALIK